MQIARTAAAIAVAASLTGCTSSQVARSSTQPGRTSITRTTERPDGTTEITRADVTTPGKKSSGDAVNDTFDIPEQEVDLQAGTVRVGRSSGTFSGDALRLPAGPTPYLLIPGGLCLLAAGFAAYRVRFGLALIAGAVGAGLIAGAFYPLAFLVAAIGGIGGAVWLYRNDIVNGQAEATLGKLAKVVQTSEAGQQIKSAMKGAADKRDRAAIDRAKRRAGVS